MKEQEEEVREREKMVGARNERDNKVTAPHCAALANPLTTKTLSRRRTACRGRGIGGR